MVGLAEFVMRGRWQALLVTMIGAASTVFCWISAAVIALVTLRKGAGSGAWLIMWALLPAGALAVVFGDSGPLTLLTGTALLALVLRASVSLSLTVLASVGVGFLAGLAFMVFGQQYLAALAEMLQQFVADLRQGADGESQVALQFGTTAIAGMLGAGTALMAVLSLLLARYWQAALYNPGGFGEEFRALRYPVGATAGMVIAGLILASLNPQLQTWAMICFIPLTFAGLALVHSWAAARGRGGIWLTWFYIAWLILDPLKLVVVFFAIADSWFDFRQRWAQREERRRLRKERREADEGDDDGDDTDA
ncbi:MAG: hypothetical protein Hals2KO_40130 [Halioglobus sp.]